VADSPFPPFSALLIDDEPLARLELRRLLKAHPAVAVAGEAGTLAEARTRLQQSDYDLVFLDIQLRGGNAFDLVADIRPEARVIFVTAYDRYAVRAFEVNALDYLLKPVAAPRLAAALERAAAARGPANPAAAPAPPLPLARDDRVLVKIGPSLRFIELAAIGAIRSCENYTELLLLNGEKPLVLRSLKAWEDLLPEDAFVRVHRQTLVNLAHVRAVVRLGGDDVQFELAPPLPPVAASRRQLADLRHRFAAAGLGSLLP
jgi:two-component system LytT family response regulator